MYCFNFRGGLSNLLYCCSLSDNVPLVGSEPRQVLLRVYGQIIRENPETVLTDSVIFGLLAEKKLGPQLLGVFTDGRVEEFVPVSEITFSVDSHCARV
jgi:choline/ethanolamine kinase